MNWVRAIEINRNALARIVAEIYALLGVVAGGTVDRLPYSLYVAAERLLRPAEAALRRLIVIAARGVVVKPFSKRIMLQKVKIVRKASGRMAFRLFDTRKRFDFVAVENPLLVVVKTYSNNPFNPFNSFNPGVQSRPVLEVGSINALSLSFRLAAAALALEDLPRQALRLVRWQMRRKMLVKPKFIFALRPGLPPGWRVKPTADVDFILRECHALAGDVYRDDSS